MSYTYAQLTQAIQDYTEDTESSFVTHIPEFISQTEKDVYNAVQALCARQNQSGTMSAGNQFVALPTNWLTTYSFALTNGTTPAGGTGYVYLIQKEPDFILEAYPVTSTQGQPVHYAYYDINTMIVGPTPASGYNVEINFLGYPASITSLAPTGTTWLSTNFDHVLLYGALRYAYVYMKGEADLIKQYTELFMSGLNEIKQLTDGKNARDTYRSGRPRVKVA